MKKRLNYLRRILFAYVFKRNKSNIAFWHSGFSRQKKEIGNLKNYYLDYRKKTTYKGPFDSNNVLMLNYGGNIGKKYNPDAVAQYALGCYEIYLDTKNNAYREKFLDQAVWFKNNLTMLDEKVGVWYYKFDFNYFVTLKNPWYTSLGQGHGISVLLRAWELTGEELYLELAHKAYVSYERLIGELGGVGFVDDEKNLWFEEYPLKDPTHILNGFVWSLWGLYDYWLATKKNEAMILFEKGIDTLEKNIHKYDNGIWTKYDLAPTKLPSIAGAYYHDLHIEQLLVLYKLTGRKIFKRYSLKWISYRSKFLNRFTATLWKVAFKLMYY
ncbi:MAG: hypothetical protein CMH70_05020 [Nitrosomonadaceae bacterium]|nr:hypothetical protein [Nitrosomonadaceae bacterium]|tara:strand:+ start:5643 stop:6620 length:978 start_codon:yes stop_codon:yes gene_type:complete